MAMTTDHNFEYVGFGRRALAAIIDWIIGFALLPVTMPLLKYSYAYRPIQPSFFYNNSNDFWLCRNYRCPRRLLKRKKTSHPRFYRRQLRCYKGIVDDETRSTEYQSARPLNLPFHADCMITVEHESSKNER